MSVAATTRTDDLAYFSNFGQESVDLGAPGMDITSTWNTSDSAYTSLSGTSMATPEVSGVFALMKAQFPAESYLQLFNRVYGAVDPLIVLSNKCRTGGRINLARALNSASSRPGNDNFASRMVLTRAAFSVDGINVDATKEPVEPNHAGNPGGCGLRCGAGLCNGCVASFSLGRSASARPPAVGCGTGRGAFVPICPADRLGGNTDRHFRAPVPGL